MGKFKIKIHYSTGSSFHNEDTSSYIELSWDNIDIAKENLQAIKEHYEMYLAIERSYGSQLDDQKIIESNSKKSWFVGEKNRLFVDPDGETDRRNWVIVDNNEKNRKKYKDQPHEFRWDDYTSAYCMKLKADNGNYMQQSNFWCGYFESLQSAEIVPVSNDFKIEF